MDDPKILVGFCEKVEFLLSSTALNILRYGVEQINKLLKSVYNR